MKKRSADILLAMLHHRKNVSIDKLTKRYNVSPRTLKKDIQEINAFLKPIGQSGIHTDDRGVLSLGQCCNPRIIHDELYKIDLYMYRMSQEERCIYIIVLLVQSDLITMEKIAEELYVSRITVLYDIEKVKKRFEKYGIELIKKSSKGIMIQYKEKNIRLMLIELFREIIDSVRNEGLFQRIMMKRANLKIPFAEFVKLIQEYERKSGHRFSDHVLYENALYLFITCNRISEGHVIEAGYKQIVPYSDELLEFILRKKNIYVNQKEKRFYSWYVIKNGLEGTGNTNRDAELSNIIIYFLSQIGKNMNILFQDDQLLVKSLLQHIKSISGNSAMYIHIEDDDVPHQYDELCQQAEANVYILERYLGFPLAENIKKSIFIHICASLIRNKTYRKEASVIISCPGSVAMGKLLEAQVKNYFNFNVIGVVPVSRIHSKFEFAEREINFVISTVDIEDLPCPVVTVNPLLETEDLNAIQNHAFMLGNHNDRDFPKDRKIKLDLRKQMEEALNSLDSEEDLNAALDKMNHILDYCRNWEMKGNINIARMLWAEHIMIIENSLSWEEALRKGGSILEYEYYGTEYIDRMIENVKEYGPYFVLSPEVALAHASSKCKVYREGLSLLVSRKGIMFDGGIKVHLLFFFSTLGEIKYLDLFGELIKMGKSGTVKRVLQKETQEEIYGELIKGYNI